ncbi:MAG: PEP-CTERM sorting domain-containing protein, partial [Terrimicrobiaceae bacterium]|nr:PEP-CTERM sorting domain-containing protein [Terrimicrobiaceae bacterium]
DYVLWSGAMWHPVFVMPAGTPHGTSVNATFQMFLADAVHSGNVDWTTTASPVAGYETQTFTLSWTAVPEPASGLLVLAGCAALAWRSRCRQRP